MISTQDLSSLNTPIQLRRDCVSIAVAEKIVSSGFEYCHYTMERIDDNIAIFSMNNGSGDHFHVIFSQNGSLIKGFAHESDMSPWRVDPPKIWPGIYDNVPLYLLQYLDIMNLEKDAVTFCIYSQKPRSKWVSTIKTNPIGSYGDGSADLLSIFEGGANKCHEILTKYYNSAISLAAIEHIYSHKTLDNKTIRLMNPNVKVKKIIGYCNDLNY